MSRSATMTARGALGLGVRAAMVTGAYAIAGLVLLITVILLRGRVAPDTLRGVLAFIFIATLASGLEPATVKAAALGKGGVEANGAAAYLAVSALKAALAAPFLAVVWRFADPSSPIAVLLWTPLLAVAGFGATDLRVLLDLRGRHALAVALKQGSLAGGVALLGLLVALRAPLGVAIGASTLARLGGLAIVSLLADRRPDRGRRGCGVRRLLADWRWVELAAISVIATIGGSIDRVFGLRLLSPADYSGYYVTYEILSKFWLLPYLLGPILFARQAAGEQGAAFARVAWALTAVAGVAFLLAVAGAMAFAPAMLIRVVGASFGMATLVFALGVVLSAFVQLRVAKLQGAGLARGAVAALGLATLLTAPLFYLAAARFGAPGLFWMFLGKVLLEGAFLMASQGWRARFSARRIVGRV